MKKVVRIIGISLVIVFLMGCGSSNPDGLMGNSNENFRNRGWVAENKDWTFLAVENSIYRMKDDGSDLQIIFEDSNYSPKFLNVVDNRLYFDCGGIIEMKNDGSDAKGIYNKYYYDFDTEIKKEFGIYAVGNYVYLGVNSRMALKDYSIEKLANYTEVHYQTVNFANDYIWFYDEEENDLLKMKKDGTDLQLLVSTFDTVDGMSINEEHLYVATAYGNELYKVTLDGSNDEKLVEEGRASSPIVLDDGLIYCNYYDSGLFLDTECGFAVIDLEGNVQEIIADEELKTIGVTKNWIYYQLHLDDNVYRYNKETKQTEVVALEQAKDNKYANQQKNLFDDVKNVPVEEENVENEIEATAISENKSEVEMSDDCREVYSQIIEAVENQKNEEKIYFREMFFSENIEIPEDGAGGVSNGYTLESSDMMYYLEDISNEADSNPELFIGVQTDEGIKIIAVYTYNADEQVAYGALILDDECSYEINLCSDGMMFKKGKSSGGSFVMLRDSGKTMPFGAFREGQDEGRIIDTDTLDWSSFKNW